MNHCFKVTIKDIANDIFKNNINTIIEEWIKNVEEERIVDKDMEMNILKSGFDRLVRDFVKFLTVEDFESYYKSNEEIAETISQNNISFEKFIEIFHLFEDSYLPLLENLSNKDFRKYITALDKLHHKTLAIVSKKYFDLRDDIIFALTKLIELRDCETAEHLDRTRNYAVMVAKELGEDTEFITNIYKASMLHDVGKVAICDNILLKPGKLTCEEFEEIKKHTIIGSQTINSIFINEKNQRSYLAMASDIALYHHEKFDGSGYPAGLQREEIPLSARILALVDAYDTIISKRTYKVAFSHEEAVRRISIDSGKHFDPKIVQAFLRIQEQFHKVSCEEA